VWSGPAEVEEAQKLLQREWRKRIVQDMDLYAPHATTQILFAPVIGTNHIYVESYVALMAALGSTIYVDTSGKHHQIAIHWMT
jgi:hypothetical protein